MAGTRHPSCLSPQGRAGLSLAFPAALECVRPHTGAATARPKDGHQAGGLPALSLFGEGGRKINIYGVVREANVCVVVPGSERTPEGDAESFNAVVNVARRYQMNYAANKWMRSSQEVC